MKLCCEIPAELHRHLKKYALMTHQSLRQVLIESLAEKTRFGDRQIAVKFVPRAVAMPQNLAELLTS